jgi:uncharacterized protein (TIGR00730 family)
MAKICVFCSSRENLSSQYIEVAKRTGELLAKRNHHLVYGGSHRGLMGEVSKSFGQFSQNITEIIPKRWESIVINRERAIITEDLGERLRKMQELSDGFITLPGGFGCLQEFGDVLSSRQLNLHLKPLTLVNTAGFYNPLIEQLNRMINESFAPADHKDLFYIASNPQEALDYIESHRGFSVSEK